MMWTIHFGHLAEGFFYDLKRDVNKAMGVKGIGLSGLTSGARLAEVRDLDGRTQVSITKFTK